MSAGARYPNSVKILCEGCGKGASPAAIFRDLGTCRKCKGERWLLQVAFPPTMQDVTPGLVVTTITTDAYSMDIPHLEAEQVLALCQPGETLRDRAFEFVEQHRKAQDQQFQDNLQQQGARHCGGCGSLFMPNADKAWTHHGACSKLCYAKMHPGKSAKDLEPVALPGSDADEAFQNEVDRKKWVRDAYLSEPDRKEWGDSTAGSSANTWDEHGAEADQATRTRSKQKVPSWIIRLWVLAIALSHALITFTLLFFVLRRFNVPLDIKEMVLVSAMHLPCSGLLAWLASLVLESGNWMKWFALLLALYFPALIATALSGGMLVKILFQ